MTHKYEDFFPFPSIRSEQKQAMDFALENFDAGKKFVILEMGTGCHEKGQSILLSDGAIKKVEDIDVEDKLMGPDGTPRKVLGLIRGHDEMVRIVPIKGKPFVVNMDHILTLIKTNQQIEGPECYKGGGLVDVSVREWMGWNKKQKHLHKLIRSNCLSFENEINELPLDPYFLGVLLGDGCIKNRVSVTNTDEQIIEETKRQASKHNLKIVRDGPYGYVLSSGTNQKNKNVITEYLKEMSLYGCTSGDKFIPHIYKTSSVENRLKLLSGLIDTDGHLHNNTYDYITKSLQLAKDIAFVVRSLGMYCSIKKCKKSSQYGTVGTYYRFAICGDINRIPVRINYKKATPRKQKKSVLRTGFKVEILDEDDYYGFIVDKDRRYLLDDFTITHNCGKSGVAVGLGKYLNSIGFPTASRDKSYKKGSWFLTTQKILQNQYVKDFGPPKGVMASIKSSSNYRCSFYRKNACSESLPLLQDAEEGSPFFKSCMFGCIYRNAKKEFLRSNLSVTNFSYFLTITAANRSGDVQASKHVVPRELLIIDECHTIEDELSKHIQVSVNENFALTHLKVTMPDDLTTQYKAHKWIRDLYGPSLQEKMAEISRDIADLSKDNEESEEIKRLATNLDRLAKHWTKVQQFLMLYEKDNWVFNHVERWNKVPQKLEFKPIDVGAYSHEYLFRFGRRVLMMSATILNKEAFCESIGINPDEAAFISIDSPFPVENRPVVYIPTGKMTKTDIERTLPKVTNAVRELLKDHAGEKGVIHSRTFYISKYLMEKVGSDRLMTHESGNRDDVIHEFMREKRDVVLVSPSSTEGLDLKGDMSRFQIICKIYWPYLGDKLVKKRMNKYRRWYAYQAAKAIVQAVGRSIRTQDDYAVTYILDSSWEPFYYKNKDLFPKYFRDALVMDD